MFEVRKIGCWDISIQTYISIDQVGARNWSMMIMMAVLIACSRARFVLFPWPRGPMVRLDGIFQVVIPPSLNGNSDQHGYPVTIISPNFHRGDDDGIPTHGGIPTLLLYESKSLNRNEVSQPIAKIIACHSGIIATVSLQYMSSGHNYML